MESKAKKETGKKETQEKKPKKTAEQHEEKVVKASAGKKAKKSAEGKHEEHVHLPTRRCKIDSCKREYRAKGYCVSHYREWRQGKFGRARFKPCKDFGCFKPMALNRHGFCEEHFQNYYVKGMEQAHAPVEKKEETKADEKAAS